MEIHTYLVPLPTKTKESIVPCADGYTLYLNDKLSHEQHLISYQHAVGHIDRDDWDREDVQEIESSCHRQFFI